MQMKNFIYIFRFTFLLFYFLYLAISINTFYEFRPTEKVEKYNGQIKILSPSKRLCEDTHTQHKFIYSSETAFEKDMVVSVKGTILPPRPMRSPGEFDSNKYFKAKHIYGTLSIKEHSIDSRQPSFITQFQTQILSIYQQLPSPFSEILIGLIIGDELVKMPNHYKQQFVKSGLIHLIVVSGSQVTLVTGLVLFLCKSLRFYGFIRMLTILGASILFFFITGGGASILRAVLTNVIALLMQYASFRTTMAHKLIFLGLLHLGLSPGFPTDLGAQLSYLTTIAVIFIVPQLTTFIQQNSGFPGWVSELISLSFSPFIITAPLLLFHFQSLSLATLLSNILIPPLIEWIVVLGIATAPLGLILKELLLPLLYGFKLMITAMLAFLDVIDSFKFSMIYFKGISVTTFVLSYIFIYTIFNIQAKYKQYILLSIIGVLCFGLLIKNHERLLHCYFLDVGQGDCTVIITPSGKTILIDAGTFTSKLNPAKTTILPFLRSVGVNKIDFLIITHYDLDHYGGATYLNEHIPIYNVIDNDNPNKPIAFTDNLKSINSELDLRLDNDISIQIFKHRYNQSYSKNNNSLIFKLLFKDFELLITGDAEFEKEMQLISDSTSNLSTDIYKVGHHGSKTSSSEAFLKIITPKLSVISAGVRNRYRHPSPEVVKRLSDFGSEIVQTNRHGTIHIKTNGSTCAYSTFLTP